jgi:hypothetical protein
MHETLFCFSGSDMCPVRSFKYVRRLNPKSVSLFQKARTSPINGMYYDNASVGHNKLGTFMTEISRMSFMYIDLYQHPRSIWKYKMKYIFNPSIIQGFTCYHFCSYKREVWYTVKPGLTHHFSWKCLWLK